MTELLSFHNDEALKAKYVARMDMHIKADELVKGIGWEHGKGCFVGCTLEKYDHVLAEKEIGIPEWLMRLGDKLFESLENGNSKDFAAQFWPSVPIGKNLERVKWKFLAFILKENIERVLLLKIDEDLRKKVVDAISQCLKVQEDAIALGQYNESAAWSAESAARSAESAARSAESAALSAAWSAESAARSAESAALSAALSAESAAWSAESAAWSAESAALSAYQRYANKLLELLKEA